MALELVDIKQAYKEMPYKDANTVKIHYKFGTLPKHFPDAWDDAVREWLDKYTCYGFNPVPSLGSFAWGRRLIRPRVKAKLDEAAPACTQGAELETVGTDDAAFPTKDNLIGSHVTSTQDECYDELAQKWTGDTDTNMRLGAYDDSTNPANLEVDSGSFLQSSGAAYIYRSVTEFNTDTAIQWIMAVWETSSGINTGIRRQSSGSGRFVSHVFAALPNPFGTASNSGNTYRLKMRHS